MGITASAMATLRPLFQNFLLGSRLFGGSSGPQDPSASHGWHNFKGPSRAGYLRSRGNAMSGGAAEFGLRSLENEVGVTTVIQSTNDGQSGKETSKSIGALSQSRKVDPLLNDSSEEFLPMQNPKEWEVRMTTEVETTRSGILVITLRV